MPVHLYGNPSNLPLIKKLIKKKKYKYYRGLCTSTWNKNQW